MRATYYISFDEVTWTRFYPTNHTALRLQQEPGEIFHRWKVDRFRIGKKLNSSLYISLQSMYFDPSFFGTEISYRVDINGVPKFYFKDTIRAGNLNTQNKYYDCTPDPDDEYEPILRSYNKKYDNPTLLFGLADTLYIPSLSTDIFSNTDFSSFADISHTVSYTNDGSPAGPNTATLYIPTPEDGAMVTVLITDLSYTGDAPRLRLVDGSGNTCSNEVTVNANGKYELTMSGLEATVYVRLWQNNLTGSSRSGTFSYQVYCPEATLNGATLKALLSRILKFSEYFGLTIATIQSTILWNDALGSDPPPAIDTYITANPTNDYVLEDTAVFNNLYVCRTDAFGAEQENLKICLKDIMDILKSKRLWWFIDEDGNFRIEHDKYFRSYTSQVDLTSSTYAAQKPEVDKKEYSYDSDNYNQINLIEENTVNEDWASVRVEYDPLFTGSDIKDERTPVTTDVKNGLDNPDGLSGGLMLLRCDANNNILWDESLITSGAYYPNQKLSPAWISTYYMDYFAEAEEGEIVVGDATTVHKSDHSFIHVRETLKQTGIKFRGIELDRKKPLTLSAGTGWLQSAEYDPETGWYNVDVLFNPYEITAPETIVTTYGIKYGYLYNWYAASEIDYLIAADGWHVPSSTEMLALRDYLDPVNNNPLTNVAGGLMKESGLIYWYTPNIGADNSVGFNGRGAGKREGTLGTFTGLLGSCTFWNTRNNSATEGGAGALSYNDDNFYDAINSATLKSSGCSIRLIKDSTTLSDGEGGSYTGNDGKVYRTICIGTQEWLADNLAETKFRNGDAIPEVTDNATWSGLSTGALCAYNNDHNNV